MSLDFSLYQQDDVATAALYQAARQKSPISVMIQLGQQQSQLFGVYMKSVVPEVPEFDDSDRRQEWRFRRAGRRGALMTRFLSLLDKGKAGREGGVGAERHAAVSYQSVQTVRSKEIPGVTFDLNRISFGRRMELTRQVRELSQRAEFLQSGQQLHEQLEANLLVQEIEATYLRWALAGINGLTIDGEPATTDQLLARGPEELTREILQAIKKLCGLDEDERKN